MLAESKEEFDLKLSSFRILEKDNCTNLNYFEENKLNCLPKWRTGKKG